MERYKKIFKEYDLALIPKEGEHIYYCLNCTKLFSSGKEISEIRCPHCGSKKIENYNI